MLLCIMHATVRYLRNIVNCTPSRLVWKTKLSNVIGRHMIYCISFYSRFSSLDSGNTLDTLGTIHLGIGNLRAITIVWFFSCCERITPRVPRPVVHNQITRYCEAALQTKSAIISVYPPHPSYLTYSAVSPLQYIARTQRKKQSTMPSMLDSRSVFFLCMVVAASPGIIATDKKVGTQDKYNDNRSLLRNWRNAKTEWPNVSIHYGLIAWS
jgi:hypothetical protein